jgi:hypothetical protein
MEAAVLGGPEARARRDFNIYPGRERLRDVEEELERAKRRTRQDAARRYPIGHPAREHAGKDATSQPDTIARLFSAESARLAAESERLAAEFERRILEAKRLTDEQRDKHKIVIAERDDALKKFQESQSEVEKLKASLDGSQVKTIEHARLDAEILMRQEDRLSQERIATHDAEVRLQIAKLQQEALQEAEKIKATSMQEVEAERSRSAQAIETEKSNTLKAVEEGRNGTAKAIEETKSATQKRVALYAIPGGALGGALITALAAWFLRPSSPPPVTPVPVVSVTPAVSSSVPPPIPSETRRQ